MRSILVEKRFAALRELGCICCRLRPDMATRSRVEIHHLVDAGYRALSGGDEATIPLCAWHHRGEPPLSSMRVKDCTLVYGPSLAKGSKPFALFWGSQRSLLARVDALLEAA